MGVNHHDVDFR